MKFSAGPFILCKCMHCHDDVSVSVPHLSSPVRLSSQARAACVHFARLRGTCRHEVTRSEHVCAAVVHMATSSLQQQVRARQPAWSDFVCVSVCVLLPFVARGS